MDTRAIGAILLKIGGLFFIGEAVASLPAFFSPVSVGASWSLGEAAATAVVTVGPLAVLGIAFWLFPGSIVNKIVAPSTSSENTDSRPIELVALTLVGVYLISLSLIGLGREIAFFVAVQAQSPEHVFVPASLIAGFVSIIVEGAIGLGLCIGARGILDLIQRLRR